ncbi:major facilitator superfamily domain-containing protein [Phascolomyces articulosus]|uniref:Major facilitator superfamily domain-containing protein n=1 Tax=Phascolomyces articulosus TaxID=60185 RepID=A0AAD5JVS4_9FUNG|nr:major facilitator superfamily domain-containing protein [Phascolomyces articulosus]
MNNNNINNSEIQEYISSENTKPAVKASNNYVTGELLYIDPAIEKSLLHKLDLCIVAWTTLAFFTDCLNRYNLQNAYIMGMDKDLNLESNVFNWAVTLFFIAGTVLQIPGTVLIGRFSPRLILPSLFVLFGAMVCVTATVHNYQGLWAMRLVAGSIEASIYPGIIFLLGCWYTTPELGKRITIFAGIGNALSGAFGGLIAGAISDTLDGVHGLAAWKWLFIVEGLLTVSIGLTGYPILGDFPHNTKWLTKKEQDVAMLRVKAQGLGVASNTYDWKKITKNVLLNPYSWLLTINFACVFFGFNLVLNFSIILHDIGYPTSFSNYMLTPLYIFMTVASVVFAWTSDRSGDRAFHIVGIQLFIGIWFLILTVSGSEDTSTSLLFVAAYATSINNLAITLCPTWVNEIFRTDHDTRAVVVAVTNAVGYIVTLIINIYTWDVSDSPKFWLGKITNTAFSFGSVVLTIMIWFLLRINFMVPKAIKTREEEEERDDKNEKQHVNT